VEEGMKPFQAALMAFVIVLISSCENANNLGNDKIRVVNDSTQMTMNDDGITFNFAIELNNDQASNLAVVELGYLISTMHNGNAPTWSTMNHVVCGCHDSKTIPWPLDIGAGESFMLSKAVQISYNDLMIYDTEIESKIYVR
jgi:hypothetical protein